MKIKLNSSVDDVVSALNAAGNYKASVWIRHNFDELLDLAEMLAAADSWGAHERAVEKFRLKFPERDNPVKRDHSNHMTS